MRKLLWVWPCLLFIAFAAVGQEATPTPATPVDTLPALLTSLVVVSTPILVRFVATLAGQVSAGLPLHYLPILAPIIGALSTIALHFAGAGVPGVSAVWAAFTGAVLGTAGTGLREVKDQIAKRYNDGPRLP